MKKTKKDEMNTYRIYIKCLFVIFLAMRTINRLKREAEAAPPPPSVPTKEQVLLEEIRDLLKQSPR